MHVETIPFKPVHAARMALLFGLPALVPLALAAPGDELAMWAASLLCVAIGGAALGFLLLRRSIRLSPADLHVRHGFYSWRIRRDEVRACGMKEVARARALPLKLRRNGVAAFGLYSGWFSGPANEDIFCAVSAEPVFVFRFKTDDKERLLAVSCSRDMAEAIRAWAGLAGS